MYSFGQDVTPDYKKAMQWYLKAAEQRYTSAYINIGVMYANGTGVTQNKVQAYKWWSIATVDEYDDAAEYAKENIYDIEKEMTSEQIAEATKLASEWIATH